VGKREAFNCGLRLAGFYKAEKKRAATEGGKVGGREEMVSLLARTWGKEIKMFQVRASETDRQREREREGGRRKEREPRSKRFYDTGRRYDITPQHFLRIGKAPELPPSSCLPVPSNYVSLLFTLNILSFHM